MRDEGEEWDGLTMRTRARVLGVLTTSTIEVVLYGTPGGETSRESLPLEVVPLEGRMPNTVLRMVNTRTALDERWRGWMVEAVEAPYTSGWGAGVVEDGEFNSSE